MCDPRVDVEVEEADEDNEGGGDEDKGRLPAMLKCPPIPVRFSQALLSDSGVGTVNEDIPTIADGDNGTDSLFWRGF